MFYVKQLRYLVLIFSVFFCAFTQAKDNYAEWIQDIEHRLDKTAHLYQQGQADEARTEVQMAYFEVFENLEGPIRINFSAQKSYQMEATFAEIRKMIGEGVSLEAIQTKINGLKSELQEVLPVLTDGHQLNASAQHDVYSNQTIAQHWQQSFKIIDNLLAQAISAYEQGEFAQAKNGFSKHNTMVLKMLKWKWLFVKIVLPPFQLALINNFMISFVLAKNRISSIT